MRRGRTWTRRGVASRCATMKRRQTGTRTHRSGATNEARSPAGPDDGEEDGEEDGGSRSASLPLTQDPWTVAAIGRSRGSRLPPWALLTLLRLVGPWWVEWPAPADHQGARQVDQRPSARSHRRSSSNAAGHRSRHAAERRSCTGDTPSCNVRRSPRFLPGNDERPRLPEGDEARRDVQPISARAVRERTRRPSPPGRRNRGRRRCRRSTSPGRGPGRRSLLLRRWPAATSSRARTHPGRRHPAR